SGSTRLAGIIHERRSRDRRVASGSPPADRRSGTPSSRPQLEELRSGERVTEPGRPGATLTTDFLWRMSSGLSRRASELLSGDVGQMMFLTIGNAVPPHDEDDLEPLSAQRAQRLTMSMPARALLIVIGARPVAALERPEGQMIHDVAQGLVAGVAK